MNKLRFGAAGLALAIGACASVESDDQATATFAVTIENIAPWTVLHSGVQAMKTTGASGGAGPGEAFEVSFTAGRNQKVSFATMFGESNDWFFGPGPEGIALYDGNGNPISGDVTSQIQLWDAGTELDQEPAVGNATGPQQPAPDFGAADPDPLVRTVPSIVTLSSGATFARPAIADMIRVTLSAGPNRTFTLHVENASTSTTLVTSQGARPIHLSPIVWATHMTSAPLFDVGMPDRGQGIELVAESGRTANLGDALRGLTGVATPLSPGAFVVHRDGNPFFSLGTADRDAGLENLAEDGNSQRLRTGMKEDAATGIILVDGFDTPVGAHSAAPALAGESYSFTVDAVPGDHLSFVTMFGMSDDWFFSTGPNGIALFDGETPISGEVTDQIGIYDAGTEVDEELAIGVDVGSQQLAPNTGPADPVRQVREVGSAVYGVPTNAHLRVTIAPL